jgi:hypothetical protein
MLQASQSFVELRVENSKKANFAKSKTTKGERQLLQVIKVWPSTTKTDPEQSGH